MHTRRHFLQSTAALGAVTTLPGLAFAKPLDIVRIVIGFPPGGTADTCSRRVAERLGGTPYAASAGVVESKPGAGGRLACDTVKAAAADGSTLLLTPYSCMAIYPHIYSKLSYDPLKDFVAVGTGAEIHHALAVGPMVPANVTNIKEFLAWAKAHPESASYGSPGAGIAPHFLLAMLSIESKVDLKHVPYRGAQPAMTDVIAGQIASSSTPLGDVLPMSKAGKCRILATSGSARSPFTPDVATYAEQGYPSLTTEEWFGFYAPARTPDSVVVTANAAINAALEDKAVKESLAVMGMLAKGSTPAEMGRSQREQYTRWGTIVKTVGFTAES